MFQLEPGLIIWTGISFALLVFLLYRSALPPLLAFLEEREKGIARALEEAAAKERKAEAVLEEKRQQLAQARRQAEQIVAAAHSEGERLKGETVAQAEKQAAVIVTRARQDISAEKEKSLSEIRREVSDLVSLVAAKVLGRVVSREDHQQLIEESIAELKNARN